MARMDFQKVVQGIGSLGLNIFDFALFDGNEVFTYKFQPCNRCNNSYSVAKAFVITALGILWDEGRFRVTDPVIKYFPEELPKSLDPKWQLVTVEHVITHCIGLDIGFLDIDTDDMKAYPTDDYLHLVLAHPLAYMPGQHSQYSDAAYYLLSRLVTKLSGEKLDTFLWKRLLYPLQFTEVAWSRCPREYPIGATGLYISTEDMLKLGMLYLNDGFYQGVRYISHQWVEMVFSRNYELHPMSVNGLIGKGGMYGQAIVIHRGNRFAAAWHGHVENGASNKEIISLLDMI